MPCVDERHILTYPVIKSSPLDPVAAENQCTVISNDAVNSEYRLLIARAPPVALTVKPGQFFHLLCPSTGTDAPFLRRPMSIYLIDRAQGRIGFLYKVQGAGTRGLATLTPGDGLDALGPLGQGFGLPEGTRHVLMLARGVGLATLAPLVLLAAERKAKVTAVLSARSPDLIMSKDYLTAAGADVVCVTDETNDSDIGAVERLIRVRHEAEAFDFMATCGSNRLLGLLQTLGHKWGVAGQIALEQHMGCGLGMCFACVRAFRLADGGTGYRRVCWDGPVFSLEESLPW